MSRKQPWRKLLYIQQPYADNYTDPSFLSQLKRNSTVQRYSYWRLICDFALISLHLSTLAAVHIVFFGIYNFDWDPMLPAFFSTLLSVLFYFIYKLFSPPTKNPSAFKSSILIMFSILTLSPVLKSLSESTSSDSIWSLSFWLCIGNLIFADYHFDINEKFNPIFATNVLIADSIVLASRLKTTVQVFCFILFAFQIYGLFPYFDIWLRRNFIRVHWMLLITLQFMVCGFIYKMTDPIYLLMWIGASIIIVFLSPLYFLYLQKYKDELQGPWDTAKPII